MKKVSIVIPTYNEEGNIKILAEALLLQVSKLPQYSFEIIYVDDGSSDHSLSLVKQLTSENKIFRYIKLSRNYGHQNAIRAGIDRATGQCVITMDGDMQHPPAVIPDMLDKWEEGYDVVYTRRVDHVSTGFFKKLSSKWFYKIINVLSEVKMEQGTADFRLLDEKICNMIRNAKEVELFFRAFVKLAGNKQYAIDYVADKRNDGKSKYTVSAMLKLALTGITSFSVKPLHLATYLGLFFACSSVLFFPYIFYSFYAGHAERGWSSVLITIVFFGGLQLFVLGIIGIYIGKIFTQVKQQPFYRIEETNLYETDDTAKL
ncbi:MAG: glycosyltransferase family 2 protein [Chitinophagaceae bacterium]|nr:glycosyltransferase family 2 protein [Chitinophagaceae bacterium]